MMKKILFSVLVFFYLATLVFANPYFNTFVGSFETRFGSDNVTVINDYQLVYFYDTVWQLNNWTVEEQLNEWGNETINVSVNYPYNASVYVASIVEIDGFDVYSNVISWGVYE